MIIYLSTNIAVFFNKMKHAWFYSFKKKDKKENYWSYMYRSKMGCVPFFDIIDDLTNIEYMLVMTDYHGYVISVIEKWDFIQGEENDIDEIEEHIIQRITDKDIKIQYMVPYNDYVVPKGNIHTRLILYKRKKGVKDRGVKNVLREYRKMYQFPTESDKMKLILKGVFKTVDEWIYDEFFEAKFNFYDNNSFKYQMYFAEYMTKVVLCEIHKNTPHICFLYDDKIVIHELATDMYSILDIAEKRTGVFIYMVYQFMKDELKVYNASINGFIFFDDWNKKDYVRDAERIDTIIKEAKKTEQEKKSCSVQA